MKALFDARYAGQEGPWVRFSLDYGLEARLCIVEPDIGRVVFRRADSASAWSRDRLYP